MQYGAISFANVSKLALARDAFGSWAAREVCLVPRKTTFSSIGSVLLTNRQTSPQFSNWLSNTSLLVLGEKGHAGEYQQQTATSKDITTAWGSVLCLFTGLLFLPAPTLYLPGPWDVRLTRGYSRAGQLCTRRSRGLALLLRGRTAKKRVAAVIHACRVCDPAFGHIGSRFLSKDLSAK